MKKSTYIITLGIALFFAVSNANATTIIIQAIGTSSATYAFNPQIANAVCGDTIRWVLVSGTHTTASTIIPGGATPWSSPNITAAGYTYVVTVAGTYNYTCHPSTGGHMDASIVVSCSTGLPSLFSSNFVEVYPNPSNGKFRVEMKNGTTSFFEVYNITGEKIFQSQFLNLQTEIDLNIPDGIYFYALKSEEQKIIGEGKLVILK